MAAILFTIGIFMGVLNILTPKRLTPLTERIATQALQNVDVKIDNVGLTIMGSFPFVHAEIENLRLLSTVTRDMDASQKATLPAYTDTVLVVKGFSGGLNVMKLFSGQLDMSDVTITTPSANFVVINESLTNFDIVPAKDRDSEKPFNWNEVPGISLKRFEIVNPGKLRFNNVQSGTELGATFSRVILDGNDAPMYRLNFDGEFQAPSELIEMFNISDMSFGLNGSLHWSQDNPDILRLANFDFTLSVLGGRINTLLNFKNGFKIENCDIVFRPINVSQVLAMVPEQLAREYDIPSANSIDTDANVNMTLHADDTWNVGSDTIPPFKFTFDIPGCTFKGYEVNASEFAANITVTLNKPWSIDTSLPDCSVAINVPPSRLKWQNLDLHKFTADLVVWMPDGSPYDAVANIRHIELQGPATDIKLSGTLSKLLTDPTFDGTVSGTTDLNKLPKRLRDAIDGTVSGQVSARIDVKGSAGMLSPENFHNLYIKGDIGLKDVYWLAGDTVNMFDIHRAKLHFGSSEKIGKGQKTVADSMMRVSLQIDTAMIVHSDLVMNLSKFNISLAAQNSSERLTKGRINPMGGNLSLATFNLLKTNDSAVVRLRDVKGMTVVKAYNNDIHTPEFIFDLDLRRVSAGSQDTRIVVNNVHTHFDARRLAKSKSAQRFSHIADSIHYTHPSLPPDSVAKYALEIHNRHRSKYPRVHERYLAEDTLDIFDWGASPLFKRLLSLWTLDGSLTSQRASIYTPYLPLRNRFRNIDISFNNDSLNITDLQYKIGHSDFTISGRLSNMRKAFTSIDGKQPLRVNFDMISDTIDVNQITETIMTGSAYSATPEDERQRINLDRLDEDEEELEKHIAKLTENAPDSMMPILIPKNLDAELSMKSNHVRYSDFDLHDMNGKILIYNGAMNMQNLTASSDVGSIDISALYSGLHPDQLRFGFGLQLKDFNLHRFLKLVPAVDSMLPVMRDFSGIISANIAATTDIDKHMNIVMPTLDAAIGVKGDSLVLLDPGTFKSLSRWLLFKDKEKNIIDHMDVQMIVHDNQVDVYPFVFDFDRYKIGVQGYNDFNMNFNYHIAVLKSPIPFKFGINVSGNPDKIKIRLGGAKFSEQQIRQVAIVDTTRINLMNEISSVFKRGARDARLSRLRIDRTPVAADINLNADTLTHEDSLKYIREGLIDAPLPVEKPNKRNRKSKRGDDSLNESSLLSGAVFSLAAVNNSTRRRRRRHNI
ncbi:MAG: hypothetical protein J1F20_01100 [Muribaculaceae bacterium]|nr:hypothetical protein [Muribaculaceae bacterium]